MTLAAAELYPEFVAELEEASGVATGYERAAAPCTSRSTATRRRSCAASHDLQRSLGLEAEWLPPRALPRAGARPDPVASTAACIAPGEALGRPAGAGRGAAGGAARPRGSRCGPGPRSSAALLEGERIAGVRTAAGEELRAGAVVLAAGAWSGSAEWLPEDARPPVRPVKGQILELRSPRRRGRACERIVASERVYLVPRPDGRLIVGATVEEQGFDTAVTAGGVHELLREAYRLLPDVAEMELVEATAGLRPGTPDNLPLVGPGALEGLVLADRPLPQRHPAGAAGRRAVASLERRCRRGCAAMRIELNGEPRELPTGATLADAVRERGAEAGGARRRRRARRRGRAARRVGRRRRSPRASGRGAGRDPGRRRDLGARRPRSGPRG